MLKIGDIHNIDIYKYSRAHGCVSCTAGVNLYVLICSNMQHTAVNLLKTFWALSNSWNFVQ